MIKSTFLFIILYWLLVKPQTQKQVNRYVTICALLLFAMMGLRNEVIFGDTFGYVYHFKQLNTVTIPYLYERWDKDITFWVISWFLQPLLGGNYTLWLLLISAVVMIPMAKIVRNYSMDPMYSWVALFFLGFFGFFMAGLRQTVAMGIVLFAFLKLLEDGKEKPNKINFIWFVVLIAVASLFHGSSLICLVSLLFVRKPRFSSGYLFFYFVTLVVCLAAGRFVMINLVNVANFITSDDERYAGYLDVMHGSTFTYFIQQLLLVVPSLYILRRRFSEPMVALLCHFSMIAFLFVSLSPVIAEMFRMSYYFSWATMLLFAIAMGTLEKRKSGLQMVFLALLVLYLVFIGKVVWQEYYFWFEDASSISVKFTPSEL